MRNKANKFIYRHIKLLYYTQRSLLHVSATYCGHLQGETNSHNTITSARTLQPYTQHIKAQFNTNFSIYFTWGVQVLRYPNFFSGMEADRNVIVIGGDVAVL